jgi:hypothetical protein
MVVKEQKKTGSKKPAQEEVLYHTYPSGGSSKRK